MDGFPYVHRERVRFRDCDPFGHVNNAAYLTYLEQARIGYLAELGLVTSLAEMTMILARAEIDFRAQATAGDEVEVGIRPGHLGTKSFTLEYELRVGGRLVGEAKTVLVGYDYDRGESVALPEHWQRSLAP